MYKNLNKHESLFVVDNQILDEFKYLAENVSFYDELKVGIQLNSKSRWAIIFSFWCFLLEDQRNIIMDYEKMMIYSSNFYCLNLLRNDKNIQAFLKEKTFNAERAYVLAYYLACELMLLMKNATAQEEKAHLIYQKYEQKEYFLLHEKLYDKPLDATLYVEQKVFVSIFSHHFHVTKLFQQHVNNGIHLCRTYLLRSSKISM